MELMQLGDNVASSAGVGMFWRLCLKSGLAALVG
jgi:hypothetical protein